MGSQLRKGTPVEKHRAFHAIAQLTADSDQVNKAIARLLHRANANGLEPAVMMGFLSHKFDVILNGLADIVMSADDDEEIVFTVPEPRNQRYSISTTGDSP